MSEKSDTTMEMAENKEAKSLNLNDVEVAEPAKEEKTFLKYFLELLSDSMVTGIPQIVTASNLLRKVFRILVLVACISGFIYQAVQFMELYRTYPSSLEVEVKYLKEIPAPSVTICNRNPVQRTQFCRERSEFCAKPTNISRFCNMYPHYCEKNTTLDDLEFVISNAYISVEDIKNYSQTAEGLLGECCAQFIPFADQCRKQAMKLSYMDENNVLQNCYVINFGKFDVESSFTSMEEAFEAGKKRCLWWSSFELDQSYSIMMNLDPKEFVRPDVKPSVQAVIHSPNDFKNPFQKGFTMEEGKRYTVIMRAFEEILLPNPYATGCTDIKFLGENYHRESCIRNCAVKLFSEKCGCLPFEGTSEIPKCDDDAMLKCLGSSNGDMCSRQCPRICHSFFFEYGVSSSNFEDTMKAVDLGDGPVYKDGLNENITLAVKEREKTSGKGKTFLKIQYFKKEITAYTYKPKYEKIEILGYIGGFSGIWLGVSLVAILDFFETIVVFFCYVARKIKVKKTMAKNR